MTPRRRTPTAEQRKQWDDQRAAKLADLHGQIVDQVATLTNSEAWRAWLEFGARFHNYSFNNLMLIWRQRPDATWVAGIRRWNAMGRRVRKGEHGIAILAPVTTRRQEDEPDPEPTGTGQPGVVDLTGASVVAAVEAALSRPAGQTGPRRAVRGFTVTTVFDITQTDGVPIDPPPRPVMSDVDAQLLTGKAPAGVWDALEGIATEHGYHVERGDCDGRNGFIRWAENLIKVRDDVDDAQAVKTLAHELGHMLLHKRDDFASGDTRMCRGEKEVEAESTAFLVAAHVGIDTSDYTFGYVTGWAEHAAEQTGRPPHEIVQAAGTRVISAATTLTTLLDKVLGHQEPPVPTELAQRVADGVQAAADVRDLAQAALFDQRTAARAFASPVARAAPPPVPDQPQPPPGRQRRR